MQDLVLKKKQKNKMNVKEGLFGGGTSGKQQGDGVNTIDIYYKHA
jgi:hypothetical protein